MRTSFKDATRQRMVDVATRCRDSQTQSDDAAERCVDHQTQSEDATRS